MINPELRDILFLDIETVASAHDYHSLDERIKTQWARKAAYFRRDQDLSEEETYHDRAGIYAEFGKVIVIGVAKFIETESGELGLRTKAYYGDNETTLLCEFKNMIEKLDPVNLKLCAHNGKEFDYPYLCRRLLINGIALPAAMNIMGKKSWEVQHLDTLDMWKFGDYKHYTSLDLLAAIFNIPTSKDGIDGSQVNSVYYKEHNLARIKDYCIRDVVVLAQLFLKLKSINVSNLIVKHSE
jgi:DNA polymerase elongation subunit (family B)